MTDNEITALKAVLFLATDNPCLKRGGTFVEDINDYENCAKISFKEAVAIIDKMLYGTAEEENNEGTFCR